ncbi:MAG: hypothetical protein L0Y71_08600 [Gemmataceae bacterium]|nr:hypothetical protein [Gemmataceae bacterium]
MNSSVEGIALACECGQQVVVTEGMAGTSVQCACGRTVAVPSYGELRRLAGRDLHIAHTAATDPTADNALARPSSAVLYAAVVAWTCLVAVPVLGVFLVYREWFAALGLVLVTAGHLWLFTQVYVGNPLAALLVLLVPILGTILALKFVKDHWRIACWPVSCQALGTALLIVATARGAG